MRCRYCHGTESKVVDSRPTDDGTSIRRRRECMSCGRRFTTYEKIEEIPIMVVKKDGRRETFDSEKILMGVRKACEKRPVSAAQMWRCSATPTGASWCAASARRPRCSTPAVCATAAATASLRLKTANAALPGRGCLNFERERYLPARGRQHQPLGQA